MPKLYIWNSFVQVIRCAKFIHTIVAEAGRNDPDKPPVRPWQGTSGDLRFKEAKSVDHDGARVFERDWRHLSLDLR